MRSDYSQMQKDAREKHTENANEALGRLQEDEGVDACVGNGDICEGLRMLSAEKKGIDAMRNAR